MLVERWSSGAREMGVADGHVISQCKRRFSSSRDENEKKHQDE
jgi:hypothetical protein